MDLWAKPFSFGLGFRLQDGLSGVRLSRKKRNAARNFRAELPLPFAQTRRFQVYSGDEGGERCRLTK